MSMTSFHLQIVTPDGLIFDGQAQRVIAYGVTGSLGILARHTDMVTPLGMGEASILADGKERKAACIGGLLSVHDGEVTLVPTTFEWAEDIDAERAEASLQRANAVLAKKDATDADLRLAEARLKRALVRKSVAQNR